MKQINYTLLLIFGLIIFFFTDCRTQKKIEEGYTGTTTTGLPITSKDYLQKGNVEMDKKNYKEALENLNKAIELDEENGEAYAYRGMTKYHLKDLDGAMEDYNHALKLIPDYGEVYDLRGIVKGEKGDSLGACEDWNKAFDLGFNKASELIEKYCNEEN